MLGARHQAVIDRDAHLPVLDELDPEQPRDMRRVDAVVGEYRRAFATEFQGDGHEIGCRRPCATAAPTSGLPVIQQVVPTQRGECLCKIHPSLDHRDVIRGVGLGDDVETTSAQAGAYSDILMITRLPAASMSHRGPNDKSIGKFQGAMMPVTPLGCHAICALLVPNDSLSTLRRSGRIQRLTCFAACKARASGPLISARSAAAAGWTPKSAATLREFVHSSHAAARRPARRGVRAVPADSGNGCFKKACRCAANAC
jgi:hypothetical protein